MSDLKKTTPKKNRQTGVTRALTVKQEAFWKAFVETDNASEAYRRAYNTSNMKPESVNRKAKELLDNGKIAARLKELRAKVAEELEITQERVLSELAAMAFYDAGDLVVEDKGKPVEIRGPADIRKLPERLRRCIVGWSYDRHGHFILKLANKTSNLELIGRHLAMFVDRKEIRVGELEKVTDAELDARIAEAANQVAKAEGIPVEAVLKQVKESAAHTVH